MIDPNLPLDHQDVNDYCACGLRWSHTGKHAPEPVLDEDGNDVNHDD